MPQNILFFIKYISVDFKHKTLKINQNSQLAIYMNYLTLH